MTDTEWKQLPDLLRRREVLALGVNAKLLDAVAVVVQGAEDVATLPARTIAAIRPARADGRRAKLFYFKRTVEPFRVSTPDGHE